MTRAAALRPAVSKELRALLPLWGASVAAVATAFMWRGGVLLDMGVFAYVVGSIAIGAHSIGQEYTHHTLSTLLSQPVDRRRVYLLKFIVAAVMLLTLAAVAWSVLANTVVRPGLWSATFIVWPLLCGLFLAPLLTMIARGSLAGMVLSASVAGCTWLASVTIAALWLGTGMEAAERVIFDYFAAAMVVACPAAGFLGWRKFRGLEATDAASPAFHLPRWLKGAPGARRHAPLRALAAKELHLQQMSFVVAALNIVIWAILLLLQRNVPSLSTFPVDAILLLYCVGVAIMIGALASAEERHHGTLAWQLLQPAPARQQWIVKVGVAVGLALLLGVGLPMLLIQLTPHGGFPALRAGADLGVVVVLMTAGSTYISSLSGSGVQAMAWSVPIGLAAVLFTQTMGRALGWVAVRFTSPLMANVVTGAVMPASVDAVDIVTFALRAFTIALTPLLLWFGFVNHTSQDRTTRRIVGQAASIALVITAVVVLVGGVLAFYELRSR